MELPIAPQTYQPTAATLIRAVKRVRAILARSVAEETALEGATALTCAEYAPSPEANLAIDLNLTEGGDAGAVIDAVAECFGAQGLRCLAMLAVEQPWPASLAEALRTRGYRPQHRHVHLLHDYAPPATLNSRLQIVPARAAYAELRDLYRVWGEQGAAPSTDAAGLFAQMKVDFLDEARLELYLGRLDQRPIGLAGVLTLGNIGVLVDLYTHPDHRDQGVATTMLVHTLDHCQRALFEQVIIETDDAANLHPLLADIGFKPVAAYESYIL